MGRPDCIDNPVTAFFAVRNQRPDADDRVIDVLGELVAQFGTNFILGLADVAVCGGEEAIDIRRDDVSFDRSTLWVRRLKGSNSGMHPLEGDELRAIRRYLATRDGRYLATRDDGLPWLFVSERQSKLTRFTVNYLVDRTAKLAGFDNLHPLRLRLSG